MPPLMAAQHFLSYCLHLCVSPGPDTQTHTHTAETSIHAYTHMLGMRKQMQTGNTGVSEASVPCLCLCLHAEHVCVYTRVLVSTMFVCVCTAQGRCRDEGGRRGGAQLP